MRVLTVLPYAPSLIRVRPYNLLRELAKRHELSLVIVGPRPSAAGLATAAALTDDIHLVGQSRLAGALGCALAAWRREPLQGAINDGAGARAAVRAVAAAGAFDVVHVEHLRAAFVEACLPPTLPRVFDSVDSISLLWERTRSGSHSLVKRAIAAAELGPTRRYEGRLMARFDRVAVTSPEDAATLRDLNPAAPVAVVPNGVDLDYFRPLEGPPQPATLVFSGKMSYHANITAALYFARSVLPSIRRQVPQVRLRIVGSDPPPAIRALGADPRIEVTGALPDLRPAIGSATVAVCPVTVKVGIQNKILEAMAMRVPVVASRQGAVGLQARIGEELLVGNDADEFARHVVGLLTDEVRRSSVAAAGRRYVERAHRWADAATDFDTLYREAIAVRHDGGMAPVDHAARRFEIEARSVPSIDVR